MGKISKKEMKDIAEERIERLFVMAEKKFLLDSSLSDRYVELARKIGMKYNVSIPKKYRMRFCNSCKSYLYPGKSCSVRLNSVHKRIVVKCSSCGNIRRFPYG